MRLGIRYLLALTLFVACGGRSELDEQALPNDAGGGTRAALGGSNSTWQAGGAFAFGGTISAGGSVATGGYQSAGGRLNAVSSDSTGGRITADSGLPSSACLKDALENLNVYVLNDATPTGGDSESTLYVGGNFSADNYAVGVKDTGDCTQYALVVGRDFALSGGSIAGGKAVFGGTNATSVNVTYQCGGLTHGSPVDFTTLALMVNYLSSQLAILASTGTVAMDGANLELTGTDLNMNVFSLDASALGNISVNFPPQSTVIINVSGTRVNWNSSEVCLNGQCGDSEQSQFVIWNFYQATTLSASGIAIEGTVLAPLATLDGSGGHIAGSVIVRNLIAGLEYHPYRFTGCISWPMVDEEDAS